MSATVEVRSPDGKAGRSVELPDSIFAATVNVPLIHQVVVAQMAAARQGTHATKTRGQVSGGGKKPYRQKGTGRARQGSIRAPQFTGGGTVHGPQPRDYRQRTPKKMKAAALRGALSDRARGQRIHIVSHFVAEDEKRLTHEALRFTCSISEAQRLLVVLDRGDERSWLALRNVPQVHLTHPDQVNTYDVMRSDDVIFTEKAFDDFLVHMGEREGSGKESVR